MHDTFLGQIDAEFALACIKLSFFFKKQPNVDDDHFMKHYNHVHSDLTVASKGFGIYKIQRYVQVCVRDTCYMARANPVPDLSKSGNEGEGQVARHGASRF